MYFDDPVPAINTDGLTSEQMRGCLDLGDRLLAPIKQFWERNPGMLGDRLRANSAEQVFDITGDTDPSVIAPWDDGWGPLVPTDDVTITDGMFDWGHDLVDIG